MKNWKTTLAGFGLAFINLYAGGMNAKTAAISVGLAALGTFAKDANVTGGTVHQ